MWIAAAVAAFACLTLAACGASSGPEAPPPDYKQAMRGAPAPLAALYAQTGYGKHPAVVPGGTDAFGAELAKLHGYPVVANVWGSWCGPCRQEFPYLQQASAKFAKDVAFVGVDAADDADAARTFLTDNPLPYPSYESPGETEAKTYFHVVGLPATVIYDASGALVHTNQGGYASQADLFADIKQYAH
jgi:cytochrome c biogenesis protein CcmG/thiol:disulfide interchange protein DsbE